MINLNVAEMLVCMGVPTSITAFALWWIQSKIIQREETDKAERRQRQALQDEREKAREQNELYIIRSLGATMALSEATARAVQRIPDAHCNGDMHAALEYATKIKHEQKDFLHEQAVHGLYD